MRASSDDRLPILGMLDIAPAVPAAPAKPGILFGKILLSPGSVCIDCIPRIAGIVVIIDPDMGGNGDSADVGGGKRGVTGRLGGGL